MNRTFSLSGCARVHGRGDERMCEADLLAIQFDQFGLDGRVQPLSRIGDVGAFDEIQSWLRERGGHKQDILHPRWERRQPFVEQLLQPDRKSTRLNSSHMSISYAVFC